jgi:general secretion pathway protein A
MTTNLYQQNIYEVLGVNYNATQKEINNAYELMIKHFDSSVGNLSHTMQPSLEERIALVQEAYDTLSNENKRSAYDQTISSQVTRIQPNSVQAAVSQMKASLQKNKQLNQKSKRLNVYQDYYGFSEKPFDLTPDPKYLYLSPKHKEVLAHLVYGLQENNGFLKIIGEVGTGKTMICRSFLQELRTDFSIAYVFNPAINELELLQTINSELGLPSEMDSKKKLVDTLNDFLLAERKKGHRVVVIIDEAQALQVKVLDQLRLLSNLETETEKLIQIVLIGQPELDQLLKTNELRQLRQRITISWELLPLNRDETRGYIQHRINVALGKGRVQFARSAIELIYKYSHGIPRMINVLADRSLLIAYTMNTKKITPKIVRPAVKDIGGLTPLPTWMDTLWKNILPGLLALGIVLFGANYFTLPDFSKKNQDEKNISLLIQENPIIPNNKILSESRLPIIELPQATTSALKGLEPIIPRNEANTQDKPPAIELLSARRIPSTKPLIISQEDKLVTYLASLSLNESRLEATNWILKKWNIDIASYQNKGESLLKSIDEEQKLLAYDLNANFDKLAVFNYPAILEIALPKAQGTKYLSLVSINGENGIFGSVDRIKMPLNVIDLMWTHKAIILWKDFENLPAIFGTGFKGKPAIWLQKNLRLLGFFKGREAPSYGPNTQRSVAKFQRKHLIKDDGQFGTESKIMLYGLSNIYQTPKLLNQ